MNKKLTKEDYRKIGDVLVRLQEECSEVIHIICKIKRFGIENYHPNDKKKIHNRQLLWREIVDLERVLEETKGEIRP